MVPLSHTAGAEASAGMASGSDPCLRGFVPAGGDQFGAAHCFAQITGRLAPVIVRFLFRLPVLILGATPRHEKILVNSNGIILLARACSDE